MSDAAGYAELAEQLGKVRRIFTGTDGGIEAPVPAMVGVTVVNSDGDPAEEYLRAAAWQRPAGSHPWSGDMEYTYPPQLMTSGACIAELQERMAAVENLAAKLAMMVAALETENIGLRKNIANLEKRCTCMEDEL